VSALVPAATAGPAAAGPRGRVATIGVLLALTAATFLAFRTTREGSILGNSERLLLEVMVFWVAWAVALACLLRTGLSRRRVLLLVVLGSVALRVAAMTSVVPLSDDLYRYAWDGAVQASGTSPYRYTPNDAALEDLRTDWLFPDAVDGGDTCAQLDRGADCTRINRSEVRTIYPPLAQVWFLGGHLAGASELRDLGWQVVALVADVATCMLLWQVLVRRERDPRWVAAFAWSPTAVLEGVQNAHVDGLATFFVVAAVAWAGRRPALSGAALGAAAMVKLYPALLLPLLLGRRPVRVLTAFVAVCAVSYLPHVLAVGADVLGYLPGYLAEEQYDGEDRYLLLRPLGLPGPVTTGLVAVLALAVAGRVLLLARRAGDAPAGQLAPAACLLLGAALLLSSPVQPWYGLPLVALAALAARPVWAVVPALTYPLFFAVIDTGPSPAVSRVGTACYLAALAVLLVAALRRRFPAIGDCRSPAGGDRRLPAHPAPTQPEGPPAHR
jgi:hypothetical protein